MMRRRRTARSARERYLHGPSGLVARAINTQTAMAAITPRVDRIIDLLELTPEKRYLDIGCGTAGFAHLIAGRAALETPPICVDIVPQSDKVDALIWPEHLPFATRSIDALTCFYFMRRFDDDVVHGLGGELARILAPGGHALILEVAPVKNGPINAFHSKLLGGGCAQVDLRGWGRLAALFTECGFDAINLVNLGPFILPPIPRVGVLLRRTHGSPRFELPGDAEAGSAPA